MRFSHFRVAWIRAVTASLLPFHGCRSRTGSDHAAADARSSSDAGMSCVPHETLASMGLQHSARACVRLPDFVPSGHLPQVV